MDDGILDLSKVIRSVSKIVREKTEDYFGNVTPLEKTLREIADEDSCTVSNTLLRELAKCAEHPHNYSTIMQSIWHGLTAEGWQWRRTYKSLALLEFLILLGPSRAKDDCMNALMTLRMLTNFEFFEGHRETGGGVRQRATSIIEYLEKPDALEAARQRAVQDAEKMIGIESRTAFPSFAYVPSSSFGSSGGPAGFSANRPSSNIGRPAQDFGSAAPRDPSQQSASSVFFGGVAHSPSWGEMGGAWRNDGDSLVTGPGMQQPPAQPGSRSSAYDQAAGPADSAQEAPNPFTTINQLQSEATASKIWSTKRPPSAYDSASTTEQLPASESARSDQQPPKNQAETALIDFFQEGSTKELEKLENQHDAHCPPERPKIANEAKSIHKTENLLDF